MSADMLSAVKLVCIATALFAIGTHAAQAQPAEGETQAAREAFEQAVERVRQEDLAGAVTLFQRSLEILPAVPTAANLARSLEDLDRRADAANVLASLVAGEYGTLDPQLSADAASRLRQLDLELGQLTLLASDARVMWIRLDQQQPRALPSRVLRVEPGDHKVEAGGDELASSIELPFSIAAAEHIELVLEAPPDLSPEGVAEQSQRPAPPLESSPDRPEPPKKSRRGLVIGLAIGAALLVGGAVAVGVVVARNSGPECGDWVFCY